MKIISWNIRGIGSSLKKRFISKIIRERSPDVLFLQETKVESLKGPLFKEFGVLWKLIMPSLGLLACPGEF